MVNENQQTKEELMRIVGDCFNLNELKDINESKNLQKAMEEKNTEESKINDTSIEH